MYYIDGGVKGDGVKESFGWFLCVIEYLPDVEGFVVLAGCY